MDISVIICTYNRCEALRRALQSLDAMSVPAYLNWEVIVVDNNSTDITSMTVREFRQKSRLPLRYVFEKTQGLSHARNTGIRNARGVIVAFTDDDCIVDKNWIVSIHNEFVSDQQLFGLGGRVELYNLSDKPVSIRTFKERIALTTTAQLFSLIPGCNMSFRREVLDKVGEFDVDFGAGKRLVKLVADDTDFIYRVFKEKFKIVYSQFRYLTGLT
jgi:glycosyltransferase involved in cell wall biosynthesis